MDPDCSDDDSDEVCDYVIKTTAAALKIHEKYNKNKPDKHNYDIAIITLKRAPRTSDIVSSILLPDDECDESFTGKDFSISGFGEINNIKFGVVYEWRQTRTMFLDPLCHKNSFYRSVTHR